MTIKVELNPEMEARLAAEARAFGIALEEYAQRLLQQAIDSTPRLRSPSEPGRISEVPGCDGQQSSQYSAASRRDVFSPDDLRGA
jgi:hypothetical protein